MTIRSYARTTAFAGAVAALIAGALALLLSTGPPGHAASAPQEQGTIVTVQGKAISWEDNGNCGADLRSATGRGSASEVANFGSSPPGGGFLVSSGFVGCVKSNATWNVDALASALTSAADSIPATNMWLQAAGISESVFPGFGDPSPAPIAPVCDRAGASFCNIGSTQPVVVGASPSPGSSGFAYGYQLEVPGSAPAGTYTGNVTFTASN